MTRMTRTLGSRVLVSIAATVAAATFGSIASAAPPAPKGAHPRLFLDAPTLASMKAKVSDPSSGVGRAIAKCKDVAANPGDYTSSGYQGDAWSFAASSCALAYQLTGDASYAASAIKLWNALLNDVSTIGDGKACVASATPDQAIAAIRRDTGYAIRFIGPHAALVYDWLHDAPGVDEALRSHSRACFRAWIDWYTAGGYHKDEAGANYHAGYVFAKTMVAIAEAGEDGAKSDAYWTDVHDKIYVGDLVANGLGTPGAMIGGDWAEGWQYGPLSVLEYALSARAIKTAGGTAEPLLDAWASDLTVRFLYALTPTRDGIYVGGDVDNTTPYITPSARILLGTIAGRGSEQAASWAKYFRGAVAKENDDAPIFDAIAEVRTTAAADPLATTPPTTFVAKGTRTVYARSDWTADAFWSVFTSPPRLVDDHQHVDDGNFVFSRGADHLIVDPSPYGSRSTLTGNAPTIDSTIASSDYLPSQTPWSKAELLYSRAAKSGIVGAGSDYARAFDFSDTPSDVPFARRDWVFLPSGEVVTIDRTRTDSAARKTYLRYRSPAPLTLSGNVAVGVAGGSKVAIHAVKLSSGAPKISTPTVLDNCDSTPAFGACAVARFKVSEYSVDLTGPSALAIHVIDGLRASESPAVTTSMNEAPTDVTPAQNAAIVGAAIERSASKTYVLGASAKDGKGPIDYWVPGGGSTHVVVDAVGSGATPPTVSATSSGGRCHVTIDAAGTGSPLPGGLPYVFMLDSSCKITVDGTTPPIGGDAGPPDDGGPIGTDGGVVDSSFTGDGSTTEPPPGFDGGADASGADAIANGDNPANDTGSCGCAIPGTTSEVSTPFALVLAAIGAAFVRRRRR